MSLCIGNFDKSILPNSIVEAVTVPQKMYGVKFDGVNSAGVRTYDAARFVWEPSTATKAGKDSFLGIPMFNPRECITEYDIVEGKQKVVAYKGDSRYDTLNASETGDVMMEFTRFYYYRPSETEWILSPEYIFGFKPAPAFYRDGKLLDKVYVGKYNLGIGYVSQSGVETLSNVDMNTIRTNLRSKGMYMWDLKWWETLKMLCLVKYANCDVQACNSAGYNSGNRTYPSGNADNVRGLDGSNTSIATNEACLTFGIENAYGNVWKFMDGVFCNDYYLYFKEVSEITNDPTSVADLSVYDKMANNIAVGGNNTELKTLTFNTDYDYITAPQTFGDGPYNDCCWGQSGLRECLVGGCAWNGGSCGLFAFNVSYAVGFTVVDSGSGVMWY